MLTGAGSLVARGIHDSLAGRTDSLQIIGANLDPQDPTALLCDRVHPIPPDTDRAALAEALVAITAQERPDLVIPCRDRHISVLAELQEAGRLTGRALVGPSPLARVMLDKWDAYTWCVERGLNFAPTVLGGRPDSAAAVAGLIDTHGLPLIAKPRDGSGSLGVRALLDHGQAQRAAAVPGMVLQPYLNPPLPADLHLDTSMGIPLFWEIPGSVNFGGMFPIGPDGERGPSMQMSAGQRLGRNESAQTRSDPDLQAMMEAAADALADAGWRGPMNVQARLHNGHWYITEFGGRFSGGTSQRTLLGLDEVGWTINAWAGTEVVPPLATPAASQVRRYLTDCPVWEAPDGPRLTPWSAE